MPNNISLTICEMEELSPNALEKAVSSIQDLPEFASEVTSCIEEDVVAQLKSMLTSQGFFIGKQRNGSWNSEDVDFACSGWGSQGDGASVTFEANERAILPPDAEQWRKHCEYFASKDDIHMRVGTFYENLKKRIPEETLSGIESLVKKGDLCFTIEISRSEGRYVHENMLDSSYSITREHSVDEAECDVVERAVESVADALLDYARSLSRCAYRTMEKAYFDIQTPVSLRDCERFLSGKSEEDPARLLDTLHLLDIKTMYAIESALEFALSHEIHFFEDGEPVPFEVLEKGKSLPERER